MPGIGGPDGDCRLVSEVSVRKSGVARTIIRCNWFNQILHESFFPGTLRERFLGFQRGHPGTLKTLLTSAPLSNGIRCQPPGNPGRQPAAAIPQP